MMNKQEVINALKAGESVTHCGNKVAAEGVEYPWEKPVLWIKFRNGSECMASYSEVRQMTVVKSPAKAA